MEYNYISSARVKKISNNALKKNKSYIDNLIIDKKISEKKITNKILNLKHFKIKDIDYISDKIKDMLKFNRYDFLINHDILENILNTQSIGLYINENDILNKKEKDFIYQATKRLNKYIKKPKLYIFSKKDISNEIKFYVDYEIINLNDWREEFYFLTCCKHKIILNTKNSYSEGFWSAILNQKDYTINIYDKKLQDKKARKNWIAI